MRAFGICECLHKIYTPKVQDFSPESHGLIAQAKYRSFKEVYTVDNMFQLQQQHNQPKGTTNNP